MEFTGLKKTLSILLVEDNPDYVALVQVWLSQRTDVEFIVNWTDTLIGGVDRVAKGDIDVIVLDLGLPDSKGVDTFHVMRAHAPDTPIVLLSAADSEALALELVLAGAQDYLVKESCNGETLVRALLYSVMRRQGASESSEAYPRQNASVIGVIGAKGGVGTTILACTLAAELKRLTGRDTLLADADLASNSASFLMGLDPRHSVLDAIANTHKLDRALWESILTPGPEKLQVLTSPALYGQISPPPEKLRQIISLIRIFHSWVVVDAGRLDEHSRAILDSMHQIVVVASTTVASLYHAKRTIAALLDAGREPEKLRLVVNVLPGGAEMGETTLKQMFGTPLSTLIPECCGELREAMNKASLPGVETKYRQAVTPLARALAGLPEEKLRPNPFSQLLSLGGLLRKSAEPKVQM